ncbi:hypothetical protein ACOSP7_002173 [Xanthoceras sorbifolium]
MSTESEYKVPLLHGLDSSDAIEEFLDNRPVEVELRTMVAECCWVRIQYSGTVLKAIGQSDSIAEQGQVFARVVSNEVGAGHPRVEKLSVLVVNANSILISIVFTLLMLAAYYRIGLPIGCVIAFKTSLGIMGVFLQTLTLIVLATRTNMAS